MSLHSSHLRTLISPTETSAFACELALPVLPALLSLAGGILTVQHLLRWQDCVYSRTVSDGVLTMEETVLLLQACVSLSVEQGSTLSLRASAPACLLLIVNLALVDPYYPLKTSKVNSVGGFVLVYIFVFHPKRTSWRVEEPSFVSEYFNRRAGKESLQCVSGC